MPDAQKVNQNDQSTPAPDTDPDVDPSGESDPTSVAQQAEIARHAEARSQRLIQSQIGRLRKEHPDMPTSVRDLPSMSAWLSEKLKPASPGADPEAEDDTDSSPSPDSRPATPKSISFDRHRNELTTARKQAAEAARKPLVTENEQLKAEVARLTNELREGVVFAEARRIADDPEVDVEPDGLLRYLRSKDPDDHYELRRGSKPGALVVWDTQVDGEATDARGQAISPQAYIVGLTKKPGLSYLKRTRLPGGDGGGIGGGSGASQPARKPGPRIKDPLTSDPNDVSDQGWAERDAQRARRAS